MVQTFGKMIIYKLLIINQNNQFLRAGTALQWFYLKLHHYFL